MATEPRIAPPLSVSAWLNTTAAPTLEGLRGSVVLIEAFQMLCPGCVSHGLPQAQRVQEAFGDKGVVVLGLHTVFEHHGVQGSREALEAFTHEYRLSFPIGLDLPRPEGGIPTTMHRYRMRGTPTQLLIDREGRLRCHRFGSVPDLALGCDIGTLLKEEATDPAEPAGPSAGDEVDPSCTDGACPAPEHGSA